MTCTDDLYVTCTDDLYVNNLVGDVKVNPGDFYRYINSQKRTGKVFHPLKRDEEMELQN